MLSFNQSADSEKSKYCSLWLTSDQHQSQGINVVSIKKSTVDGEASRITAQPERQSIKHHTKQVPSKPQSKTQRLQLRHACLFCFSSLFRSRFSQFTILYEDALRKLISFFEDLLVVDVGHGRDEALEEEQDVTDLKRSKLFHYFVPPCVTWQRWCPRFRDTANKKKKQESGKGTNK